MTCDGELRLYPIWREAIKTLIDAGLTYGSTVTREQIMKLCEIPEPKTIPEKERFDLHMMRCTTAIKEELLTEHQMLMVTNYDSTYRIVAPKDQTAYAVERGIKSIAKEMRSMSMAVHFTDREQLSDHERRCNADAAAKISLLNDMMASSKSELRRITE